MSIADESSTSVRRAESTLDEVPVAVAEQFAIERFLFAEVELLDAWKWRDWYNLFAPDARYRMPVRRNRLRRQRPAHEADGLLAGLEVAHYDDDMQFMELRIVQLETGKHWAEDPPSRTRHLISNVRASKISAAEYGVRSNFLVYRTRLDNAEYDLWAGERHDVLRVAGDSFQIADRLVLFDQSLVLSTNLSVFF
jgi:biphenyl 2,3-dioxygenase beta subunit